MNPTNLRRLLTHLHSINARQFNMGVYVKSPTGDQFDTVGELPTKPECGTVACIAGHIALKFRDELPPQGDIHIHAADWLGLDVEESCELFLGNWANKSFTQITLDDAINHLEDLAR